MKTLLKTILIAVFILSASTVALAQMRTEAYWEGRLATAKQQLAAAQTQLSDVQAKQLRNRTLGGPGMQERMAEYAKEIDQLNTKIAGLQQQINGGIAEEAREAGAPETWTDGQ